MRAANMQVLTDEIKRRHPGVVIYGVGDEAHKLHVSGHNEDDTPGSKADQSDPDNRAEHRAIDVMIGPAFSKADGDQLVANLLADPAARKRLFYIIWYGYIWSRSTGWKKVKYNGGDPHTNHPHIEGWAADDENAAGWPAVHNGSTKGVTPVWCVRGDKGEDVRRLQLRLKNLGYDPGTVDSSYGDKTVSALKSACTAVYSGYNGDGRAYQADEDIYLDVLMARKYGKDAPDLTPILNRMRLLEQAVEALVKASATEQPTTPGGFPTTLTIKGGTLEIGQA